MSAEPTAWRKLGYEAVVGLEVHVQLATRSKIFCGCRTKPEEGSVGEASPNAFTCPVCTGQPGALPALNAKVVEYAVRAGLATGCRISLDNVFARKNYFYPDLPKGYQISQFDLPICVDGHLDIEVETGQKKRVSIQRIHMEEDAGKSIHAATCSIVNLNRAGVPLVEIVSGPDMSSPEEAGAYLRSLYSIVTYLGICDGNLQEGNFRCDANVSVRPLGSEALGTRAEIKNVNSFRFVEKAIEVEILRQIEVIQGGGKVVQETRLYDPDRNQTATMRTKEEADDYRYFPDPDLIPVRLDEAYVEAVRGALPELPEQKRSRYASELGLTPYDAGVLTASKEMASFFESTLALMPSAAEGAKPAANLLTGEVARRLNDEGLALSESKLRPEHLAELVRLLLKNEVSSTNAKKALQPAMKSGEAIGAIIDREGLRQVSDLSAFEPAILEVLAASPAQVAEFRAGKEKVLGFFVGQVMKRTGGKANPGLLQELIRKKLSE